MKIGEFIKKFRLGVKEQNNGKPISVRGLANLLHIDAETIRNAERGYTPKDDDVRIRLKLYFKINSIEDLSEKELETAIKNFDLNYELSELIYDLKSQENNIGKKRNKIKKIALDLS